MCSLESRIIELNDSHQGENYERRWCLQKERKSKSQRKVYLKSSAHARNEGNSSNSPPHKIGEDGNDVNRHVNSSDTKGIIVYTRRAKKKTVEDEVCKPSTDTSGLSSYTTCQSESAEKTDKYTEKSALNTSMPQEQKESDPRPQGSQTLLQSMKKVDSNHADKLLRSRETIKEKYARLRSRQKQRISLRNKNRAVFPSTRIRLDAGITESVRVHTHTPQHSLKNPVLLNPVPLTCKSPSVDHSHSCINSCLNFPILKDPRRIRCIQGDLAGTCHPLMSWGSNVASDLSQGMVTFWSGQELDSLWIGVRKYGQGNWVKMLRDPSLCFSGFKSAQDLAERWNFERLKILDSGRLSTWETDNFVSTDLRLNSLLPYKNRVHVNPRKPLTRNLQVGGRNGIYEREFVKSEENEYSSEGTISE